MKKIASSTIFNLLVSLTLGFVNAAPNIVMFLTDDQDLVLNGLEPMPKTREWFSGGQIFENAFVSTPVCCPSRSSLLTGRYQHNTKVVNNSVAGNCYGEEWRSESGLEARYSFVFCFQEKNALCAVIRYCLACAQNFSDFLKHECTLMSVRLWNLKYGGS